MTATNDYAVGAENADGVDLDSLKWAGKGAGRGSNNSDKKCSVCSKMGMWDLKVRVWNSTAKRVNFTALRLCAIENRKCLFLKSVFRTVKNAYEKALGNGIRRAIFVFKNLCWTIDDLAKSFRNFVLFTEKCCFKKFQKWATKNGLKRKFQAIEKLYRMRTRGQSFTFGDRCSTNWAIPLYLC